MAVGYAKSCLIGAIMESIVYGLYLTYFLQSVRVLRRKLVKGPVFIYLAMTTFLLFVLITMRMVLDNKAAVEAFTNDPLTPNAAETYYTSYGNGAMFRTGTYIALTIVADIFVVYRVFAVWSRNIWITISPFLLAIADVVSGALVLQTIRHLETGAEPDGASLATRILIFYGLTLGLNLLCTLLIGLRFYIAQRQAAESKIAPSMNLSATLIIVVESAALYSVCLIVMMVPTAMGDNTQYCMLSMMPGVVGLAFSLVIVRIGSGKSPRATTGPGSTIRFVNHGGHSDFTSTQHASQYETQTESESDLERNTGISVHFSGLFRPHGTPATSSGQTRSTQLNTTGRDNDEKDVEKSAENPERRISEV
ncbi:hypothetical protein D9758_012352 [Tetrapyrgos nigripes]|uniref:Uncharacterized protein n=1 Tax=Tetrapyrgos nigripes TaxID=182062 RepID=A0A8H5CMM0_9AGAR|nr:hypothetical protein D9758_012352 [Tetrapyrgos nigripes]